MNLPRHHHQSNQLTQKVPKPWLVSIILIMSLSALVWILNSEGIIQGSWSTIFSIVFMVFSVIIGFLQWYAQISPEPTASLPSRSESCFSVAETQSGWGVEDDVEEICIVHTDQHVYVYTVHIYARHQVVIVARVIRDAVELDHR